MIPERKARCVFAIATRKNPYKFISVEFFAVEKHYFNLDNSGIYMTTGVGRYGRLQVAVAAIFTLLHARRTVDVHITHAIYTHVLWTDRTAARRRWREREWEETWYRRSRYARNIQKTLWDCQYPPVFVTSCVSCENLCYSILRYANSISRSYGIMQLQDMKILSNLHRINTKSRHRYCDYDIWILEIPSIAYTL